MKPYVCFILLTTVLLFPKITDAQSIPLGDALDAPSLTWTTGGNAIWLGQTNVSFDGVDAAQSGAVTNSQESWLETTVTGPGVLTFWWKVSSEGSYDFLEFYVNSVLNSSPISGEQNWQKRTVALGVGPQTLRWRYVKDFSVNAGQDRGWVDSVTFTVSDPAITSQPVSQNKNPGESVTFSVTAAGSQPLRYQWKFSDAILPGETNSSLAISNVDILNAGPYQVTVSNSQGAITSDTATLSVSSSYSFKLVHYNTKGNGVTDWSTNSAQVKAIARQIAYLNPDVVTFNEIPDAQTWEMTNFVNAFFPGYSLATNSTSDGYIRSVILSRYPISRSQSWMGRVNLSQFGYNGPFTRDLFEAEIQLPEQPRHLHVFTTHLKAGTDSTSLLRRAAEARAVSNFFVTVFLPTHSANPYAVTGDLNEDVYRPPSGSLQPIQILTTAPTGLQLSTPVNAFSGEDYTLSIQVTLDVRFDYILTSQSLWTNIINSQVFRTDLLANPPPPLLANDDITASDHLPVLMEFNNPFTTPVLLPRITGNVGFAYGKFGFNLKGRAGRTVVVDASPDLKLWLPAWTNVLGTGPVYFSDPQWTNYTRRFYRLRSP